MPLKLETMQTAKLEAVKLLGYKGTIGRNKAGTFAYFKEFNEVWLWVMSQVQLEFSMLNQVEFDISIKQIELKKCADKNCNNLIELDDSNYCLSCEKLREV